MSEREVFVTSEVNGSSLRKVRQPGAPLYRTPILYWTGVTIELHLLSGVVSNSNGLSSFDEGIKGKVNVVV